MDHWWVEPWAWAVKGLAYLRIISAYNWLHSCDCDCTSCHGGTGRGLGCHNCSCKCTPRGDQAASVGVPIDHRGVAVATFTVCLLTGLAVLVAHRLWSRNQRTARALTEGRSPSVLCRLAEAAGPCLRSQVFISHTGRDDHAKAFAASILAPELQRRGVKVIIDFQTLQPGQDWGQELVREAANSQVFVAVLSKSYTQQFWCMLELDLALNAHKLRQLSACSSAGGWEHFRRGTAPLVIPVFLDDHHCIVQSAAVQHHWEKRQMLQAGRGRVSPVGIDLGTTADWIDPHAWAANVDHMRKLHNVRIQEFAGKDALLQAVLKVASTAEQHIKSRQGLESVPADGHHGRLLQVTGSTSRTTSAAAGKPGGMIRSIMATASQVVDLCDDVVYCRYRARRLKARTDALLHCLEVLPDHLPQQAGSLQAAYQQTLTSLQKVLQRVHNLVCRFSSRGDNLLGRTLEFLRCFGFRDEFEMLDSELLSCTSQLVLVMQTAAVGPQVASKELKELPEWQQQNRADRAKDLQELEQQILGALCGLGRQGVQLEDAVQQLEVMLQAHNQNLGQMVSWLEHMNARHVSLSGHLQQVADRVDEVAVMTSKILAHLQQSQLVSEPRNAPLPPFLIPSSSLRFDETPEFERWGGCGSVVKASRDRFGVVAVKMYNLNQVGEMDTEAAVREAVKLCRVNHHNVVRCFGILSDTKATGRSSVSGSLVLEWVEGGDMYRWLQRRKALIEVDVGVRMMVMLQVAAGMKHLHQQNLVHGDVKHQNVLLQFPERQSLEDDALLDVVPLVKICDFGLAKHNSTTQTAASSWTTAKFSPRYTSPERLRTMQRSFEDDVYAFGMLMYFAVTSSDPFPDATDDNLMTGVVRGVRPDIDLWAGQQHGGDWETAAVQYAHLAKQCWRHNPEERPSFQEVYALLEDILWPSTVPTVLSERNQG